MAANEQKIKFSLVSSYDGKGFAQAQQAIDATAKNSAKAADGVQKLAYAATTIKGPIGDASQKVVGFAGTFKYIWDAIKNLPGPLKIAALALASFFGGIKIAMDICAKRAEEVKARMEGVARAFQTGIKSRLNWLKNKMDEDLAAIRDSIKETITQFDKLIGRINKVSGAKAEVRVAEADNRQAQLRIQRAQELVGIDDEDERAIMQARQQEKALEEERNEILRKNIADEKEANRNLKNAQDRRAMLEGLIAKAKDAVATAEQDAAAAAKTNTKDMQPFNDRVKQAHDNLAKVEEELKDQNIEVAVAEEKRKATLEKNDASLADNTVKMIEASEATKKLIESIEKNAKAKEEDAERTRLQNEIKKIREEVTEQTKIIDQEIDVAKKNIADINDAQDRTRMGMAKDHEVHNGIGGEGFKYETTKDGVPADLAGWERAQRYADRADRDAKRAQRAASADEKKLKELRDKEASGKKLTDGEKKKKDKLEQWDKERTGKQKEEERIKKLEEDKKALQTRANEAVIGIERRLANLGLKK